MLSTRRGVIIGLVIGSLVGGTAGATILSASEHAVPRAQVSAPAPHATAPADYDSSSAT